MQDDDAAQRPRQAALAIEPARFRALGRALVDRLADELARLRERPITSADTPASLRDALGATRALPLHGEDAGALLDQSVTMLFEHSTLSSHPRFHGYIATAPAPIGVLAELLAAALNANVALWQAAPMASEIEAQTMRWLAELVGYPADSGGLLTSGGSAANGIALQLALHARLPRFRDQGLAGARLAVYASDQTHGWLPKAVEQAGLGLDALRWIASDADQRLDLAALARALAADRAAGVRPLMVVGTAGTVGSGAVDPLAALAALCRAQDLWFHVDGAYGAPAACLLDSEHAAALGEAAVDFAALAQADSLALDPHKWLYAPIEAGGLLVREPQRLIAAFGAHRPSYYGPRGDAGDATTPGGADDTTDFHALGPQNTRGFRALKVWLALRMAGRDGYRRMIADDIALAERLLARVRRTPGLQPGTRQLSIATFRIHPGGNADAAMLDRLNLQALARLRRNGRHGLSSMRWHGQLMLRACITNFHTDHGDIDALVDALVDAA